jgi:hypothetical protein
MADRFCLKMPDFHVTFRDLLHAVNLQHGTSGFASLPKEVVLRIFSPWKIRRLRLGFNPRTWVLKASTQPLDHRSRYGDWNCLKYFCVFFYCNHQMHRDFLITLYVMLFISRHFMLHVLASSTVSSLGSMNYSNKADPVQPVNYVTNALENSALQKYVQWRCVYITMGCPISSSAKRFNPVQLLPLVFKTNKKESNRRTCSNFNCIWYV